MTLDNCVGWAIGPGSNSKKLGKRCYWKELITMMLKGRTVRILLALHSRLVTDIHGQAEMC